ncbi:alanine racemase [Oceanicola sp. S124]|uniref:alanine racemase n=1 Tax=Oceanicola sp. S124 TaxID=1042378 RepID=UPI0002558D0E|nr:alanine racemase [Oceanicola sp. S124]
MTTSRLSIDLDALKANWRALDAKSAASVESGAVVKANGYGLGAPRVAQALAEAGARRFFVAAAEEGLAVRQALGPGVQICVFSGHGKGDAALLEQADLVPMLNSVEQFRRHRQALPGAAFGVQLDSGMNRLGLEPADWAALRDEALAAGPELVMSHLACADEPDHPMNRQQLAAFRDMVAGLSVPCSLSATGGILLGPDYHFQVTRPGCGMYGGLPFAEARPVAYLDLPVIQTRQVAAGESVGYGNTWVAERVSVIATVAAGYADGLHRLMGPKTMTYAGETACPIVGRISMDLITVDVTGLPEVPDYLALLNEIQTVDDLAANAETIGYEILTSLGARYARHYRG